MNNALENFEKSVVEKNNIIDNSRKLMLNTLYELCRAEGGNGDVQLIVDDYKNAAEDFRKILEEKEVSKFWDARHYDSYIVFSCGKECIYFSFTGVINSRMVTTIKTSLHYR